MQSTAFIRTGRKVNQLKIAQESIEDKIEPCLPKFNGNDKDEYRSWSLRVKATLDDRDLSGTFAEESVEQNLDRRARSIILNA